MEDYRFDRMENLLLIQKNALLERGKSLEVINSNIAKLSKKNRQPQRGKQNAQRRERETKEITRWRHEKNSEFRWRDSDVKLLQKGMRTLKGWAL